MNFTTITNEPPTPLTPPPESFALPELLSALTSAVRDLDGSVERVLAALETLVQRRITTALDDIHTLRTKLRSYGEVRVDLGHEDEIRALLREMDPLLILPDEERLRDNEDDLFHEAVGLFDRKYEDANLGIEEENRWCDLREQGLTWYYACVTFPVPEEDTASE